MVSEASLVDSYPLDLSEPPKRIFQCDHIDAYILVLFQKGITSIRDIREQVGKRTEEIVKRVSNLRAKGVIKHIWELHHVGLTDNVILFIPDSQTFGIASVLTKLLPVSHLETNSETLGLQRLRLPAGNSINLVNMLQDFSRRPEVYFLGERIYGSWYLSDFINEWNSYHGTWDPHEERMDEWNHTLEQIR